MRKLFILFSSLWMLMFSCSVFAQSTGYYWAYGAVRTGSAQEACNVMAAKYPGKVGNLYNVTEKTAACFIQAPGETSNAYGKYVAAADLIRNTVTCAAGEEMNPTTFYCGPPVPTGPQCDVPDGQATSWTQKRGTASVDNSSGQADPGTKGAYPRSSPTCGLKGYPDVVECHSTPNADGKTKTYYCTYSGVSDGTNAPAATAPTAEGSQGGGSPANESTPADSSGSCPRGTVQAGYDSAGTPICMGSGTNPGSTGKPTSAPTSTSTSGTDAAGNKTETTTTTSENSDGSTTTTTTTTTTAPDGTRTVTGSTSTSTTANGSQGEQDKPADDFCKQNPNLMVCRNSSVSGSCGTIACTGDAIQCATLQQAAALRCARDDDEKALKASAAHVLGQAVLNGADPDATKLPTPGNATAVNVAGSLDTSGWLGGGSCFPDKVIVVMGSSITLPFGQACGLLVVFRYALMVVAGLLSFKVLRGSILGE